jgi:translation elongation factor EF-G
MKTRVNLGVLGAMNHGKTSLTDAILIYCKLHGQYVGLGCDPGMTKDGKKMIEKFQMLGLYPKSRIINY